MRLKKMKAKADAKELLKTLTDGLKACRVGFQTVEDHENLLDARITALEERFARLEEKI